MFVLPRTPTALPRYATNINGWWPLRNDCLHPLRHIIIVAHQNRAGVTGHRLGQALPTVLLHIAEHRAHQVDRSLTMR